jgi:hypothetical protein
MTGPTRTGFVHARDGRLVDGSGSERLLRGVGLGNWLLPEGYMWKLPPPAPQSGRGIEALVEDLVGADRAAEFWSRFRDVFIAEADIAAIARDGFDHVRLPLNARYLVDDEGTLLESGFEYVDRLVAWCRRHGLWVILDLHGAPGGQTGTNIDDSPRGLPELFVHDRYRTHTVDLWRAIAERYAHDPTVAGYDLLNEPLPNDFQHRYERDLVDLYRDLTREIRAVDRSHLIIYEGSHWATNWTIFDSVWDENSMLQFHKYWSPPDRPSIQRFLDIGDRLGLPIYMGEGGENNPGWLQTAFELYESCGVSWNLWPWKKIDTTTSPVSVRPPRGWERITGYASGRSDRPGVEEAGAILDDLLERFALSRCERRTEVVNACFRRAPLTLPASGFGFEGPGESYETTAAVPLVGFRNDDAVTIRHGSGEEPETINFSHNTGLPREPEESLRVELGSDDWVAYTFTAHAGPVVLEVIAQGSVRLWLDDVALDPMDSGHRFAARLETSGSHRLRVGAGGEPVSLDAIHVRTGEATR